MFSKVLVANRGEIACRILRTCARLGIKTVAVYSDADRSAPHVEFADEAVRLGPAPVRESYLNVERLLEIVRETKADAVHPGYGLVSESAAFAESIIATGATFIGPPLHALHVFGDKMKARALARSVGIAPPPGTDHPVDLEDLGALRALARSIDYPLLVKAAGGGGGIGMQIVRKEDELERAAKSCSDRGRQAFGDARVYLERYLAAPRHIEVQILADHHGTSVALGERECSVQRRHQKVIEETPSVANFFDGGSGEERRNQLFADALRIVRSAEYVGAGTVEFIADASGALYFLEVNARLQVEHPVTELVTGLDLVEQQLRVAAGEALARDVVDVPRVGHAIEARLYAEDPEKSFAPQPGILTRLRWPTPLEGVRIDTGVREGTEVTPFYDPLLAKVIAHAENRSRAIERLDAALAATVIELTGPKGTRATNRNFLRRVLADPRFQSGAYDTTLADTLSRS